MKKQYIIPSTISLSFPSGIVCQTGSVHGNANLQYNGGVDPNTNPDISAF